MGALLLYLLKSSLASGIFFLFYHCYLRKESFHTINRFYLLSVILFSYTFPFVTIEFNTSPETTLPVIQSLQANVNHFMYVEIPATMQLNDRPSSMSQVNWLIILFMGISTLFSIRFLKHLLQLRKTIRANEKVTYPLYTLVLIKQATAFSFFRYIFISHDVWHSSNRASVFNHERSHLKHKHSLDRLFMEILLIFFWMNPFIYLYRKALEEVHEYQADNDATASSYSPNEYFKLVVQQSASNTYSPLMSPFSYKLIKKRITMSTQKSNPIRKISLIVPVVMALLLLMISSTPPLASSDQAVNKAHNSAKTKAIASMETSQLVHQHATFFTTISEGIELNTFIPPIRKKDLTKITSTYGIRKHPIRKKMMMHNGIDYMAPLYTEILAIADGTVREVNKIFEEGVGHGRFIIIDHTNGYSSLYSQLNGYNVTEGQQVKQGDVVAYLGSSGMSTGPHLHLEIKKDGQYIDPDSIIK